jgi:hypothetical protein
MIRFGEMSSKIGGTHLRFGRWLPCSSPANQEHAFLTLTLSDFKAPRPATLPSQKPTKKGYRYSPMSLQNERACVYTCLIGDYEQLTEQPCATGSKVPFICLTDKPHLASGSWTIRYVKPVFPSDPVRSQRHTKILPHLYLTDYQRSLYIDNTVQLIQPPEEFLDHYKERQTSLFLTIPFEKSVLEEFLEVARGNFDEPARIWEQLNHYLLDAADVLAQKPFFSGILMRRHGGEAIRTLLEIWASHIMRNSRRDQLSLNIALQLNGFVPKTLVIDTSRSESHVWPVSVGRDRNKGNRDAAKSMMPLAVGVRELELAIKEQGNTLYESQKQRLEAQSREALHHKEMIKFQEALSQFQSKVDEVQAEVRRKEARRFTVSCRARFHHLLAQLEDYISPTCRSRRSCLPHLEDLGTAQVYPIAGAINDVSCEEKRL